MQFVHGWRLAISLLWCTANAYIRGIEFTAGSPHLRRGRRPKETIMSTTESIKKIASKVQSWRRYRVPFVNCLVCRTANE